MMAHASVSDVIIAWVAYARLVKISLLTYSTELPPSPWYGTPVSNTHLRAKPPSLVALRLSATSFLEVSSVYYS